jgi:hypothetical protein
MILAELYLLKDFLGTLGKDDEQELLSFLDVDTQEVFTDLRALPFNPSQGLLPTQERLLHIHPSWFVSILKDYNDSDKYLLIAALPESVHELLMQHFQLSRRDVKITSLGKEFISEKIYRQLTSDVPDLLPQEALPLDPLNVLLNIPYLQLVELIDLLSLHDLHVELKSLISAKKLKTLHTLLTPEQKKYLQQLQKKHELLAFKPLGLCYWNGDPDILKKALHQRGLNRLAKALYSCCSSLQWYILHKLDIGRSTSVQTLMKDLKNKTAHDHLIEQITHAATLIL